MRFFNAFSIRAKLIFLVTASCGIALSLCCAGFVINDLQAFRAATIRELRTRTEVLAFNSTAVLTFEDSAAAEHLLDSLRLQPSVDVACLYNSTGQVLATYIKDGQEAHRLPAPQARGHRFNERGQLELFQQVLDQGEPVGTLYVLANMDDLNTQLWEYARIAAVVTICSLAISILLSIGMQRAISSPLRDLVEASERITAQNDFSIRVEPKSDDELGTLCRAFNRMVGQVELSEMALHEANEQLEERVRIRTRELEEEIGRREKIQTDLERSRDAAEAANLAKSQFLANMSHEIRTPMNAILGFTALLRKGADQGDEAERQDYLATIHKSGKHLLGLINDILDLSKIEAGKLEIQKVRCSPHEIIAEIVSVLRVRAQEKGLHLEYGWTGGVPETIQTDPDRLRELMMNLVGNAVKFTKHGQVQILVRLIDAESEPKMEIRVIDTGIGIARDKFERIFDPFSQADNSITREFGGTGLGLPICRRIAEALGGHISVESDLGRGSQFTVIVEAGSLEGVKILDSVPTDGMKTVLRQKEDEAVSLSGNKILLVEDGLTNRKLIRLMLQRAGADVDCAENGQVGVDMALEHPYDLILMDMQMPIMDGFTATTRLRRKGVIIPIIALTAQAMKGDRETCRSAGCSGYLTKPVDPDTLVTTIARAIQGEDVDVDATAYEATSDQSDDKLVSTLPMDDPVFREIVEEFIKCVHEKLDEMRRAANAQNLDELSALAHWLKGAGGTAGFAAFTEPARHLEVGAKQRQTVQLEGLLQELESIAARLSIPSDQPGSAVT
ncbi:MAG: response regulator [Pirellulales bacterium]|nr:response regulator [Pirellulales bacterium]